MRDSSVDQPSVLVIEDLYFLQLRRILHPHVDAVEATNFFRAEELLASDRPFDAILFDYDLGLGFDSIPLVRTAAKRFGQSIPLIAMSGGRECRTLQMHHGCTHEAHEKEAAAHLALSLLRASGKLRAA